MGKDSVSHDYVDTKAWWVNSPGWHILSIVKCTRKLMHLDSMGSKDNGNFILGSPSDLAIYVNPLGCF